MKKTNEENRLEQESFKSEFPLVSVIIPTYKRPDTLPRTIQSILRQTYTNYEIIVVDDNDPCSLERTQTEAVMSEYKGIGVVQRFHKGVLFDGDGESGDVPFLHFQN